jgi:polyphosphate kinase 2
MAKDSGKGEGQGTAKGKGKDKGRPKDRDGSRAAASGSAGAAAGATGASRLSRKAYEEALEPLEVELNRLARWLQHTGHRMVVVFEGRDTAGKGGAINAIADALNPRQCHVVALSKPSELERSQWYFQRYVPHLPAAGQIVLFDRSWYNRAGVERIMGWCTDDDYRLFLAQAPAFERMLVDDGIVLLKYWLTVDQVEQEQRLAERLEDPVKRWKLSPIDLQARERYRAYGEARDAMLEATDTRHAPWTLVDFNDQRLGRLTLIRHLLDRVPDVDVPPEAIVFPPLPEPPLREVFRGRRKPIRPFPLG